MIYIIVILLALTNALMDRSSENRFKRKWWNKSSWRNKWKNRDKNQGEAFLFSSTILVFLTDGWHLLQFLFHSLWQLGLSLQFEYWYWWFLGIKIGFSLTFELIYRRL